MKTKKIVMSLISGHTGGCDGMWRRIRCKPVRTTTDVNMRAKPDNASAVLCVLPKNAGGGKAGNGRQLVSSVL